MTQVLFSDTEYGSMHVVHVTGLRQPLQSGTMQVSQEVSPFGPVLVLQTVQEVALLQRSQLAKQEMHEPFEAKYPDLQELHMFAGLHA